MARMAGDLKDKLERDPSALVNVIVQTQGESAAYVDSAKTRGLTVRRAFTLIHGLALTGPASAVLALAKEPWVVSVEEDRQVHTMG